MPAPRDNAARVRMLRIVDADHHEFGRLSQQRKTSPWTRVKAADHTSDTPSVERLATLRDEVTARFELELNDMRATLLAMTSCCEQSLNRLRDVRFVTFEAASSLVSELAAARDRERLRAEQLSTDLTAAAHELAAARQECQLAREKTEDAVARAREAEAEECRQELASARQLAENAAAAESRLREELVAVRTRNQEIIDAQMLRLVEFKRELELASAESGRARANAVSASPVLISEPSAQSLREVSRAADLERNRRPPEFGAIEAVLAGNPPAAAWQGLDS